MHAERRQRLLDLIEQFPPIDPDYTMSLLDGTEYPKFLLIETSRYDGTFWLTAWDTPDDAASYHDCQDYPEDFNIHGLYDLDTGALFKVTSTTTVFATEPTTSA